MNPVVSGTELIPKANERLREITISNTLLSLIIVVDLLLLPMFHLGPIPFKISYLILGFWLVRWLLRSSNSATETKDIKRALGSFAIILCCIFIGELWLAWSHNVHSYYEAIRGTLTFAFAAIAFGLGRSSKRFRPEWLCFLLYTAIVLNLFFIVFKNNLPSWLINFYYPEQAVSDAIGFQSVEEIMMLARPRGLFGNPNASMLMINLIVLFIHLSIRNGVLHIRSALSATLLIVLPVSLAMLLLSRSELVVASLLAFLSFRFLRKNLGRWWKIKTSLLLITFIIVLYFVAVCVGDGFVGNIERINTLLNIFDTSADSSQSIVRPLMTYSLFLERFSFSPLFGSGISAADTDCFIEGTQYFHNDLFYILTISGIIGLFSLFWLLFHLVRLLGWPVIIPFVLPGLTNTFVLNIPAFISYFALAGVLLTQLEQQRRYPK